MLQSDADLGVVAEYLAKNDPTGARTAGVLRRTYDMLLDGQHTGRYRWDQLYKTEKTHFGTLVEINLQRSGLEAVQLVLDDEGFARAAYVFIARSGREARGSWPAL